MTNAQEQDPTWEGPYSEKYYLQNNQPYRKRRIEEEYYKDKEDFSFDKYAAEQQKYIKDNPGWQTQTKEFVKDVAKNTGEFIKKHPKLTGIGVNAALETATGFVPGGPLIKMGLGYAKTFVKEKVGERFFKKEPTRRGGYSAYAYTKHNQIRKKSYRNKPYAHPYNKDYTIGRRDNYGYKGRPFKKQYFHQPGGDIWLPYYDQKWSNYHEA